MLVINELQKMWKEAIVAWS